MNKKLLILLISVFALCGTAMAQSTAFKYQAIARSVNGGLLTNTPLNIRLSIRTGTPGGTVEYQETQSTTTDQFGLFSIEVGSGTPTVGTFANVNWTSAQKYIQTEVDLGSGYVVMGVSKLLSVPYAIFSFNPGNPGKTGATGANGATGATGATGNNARMV
ncbi:hypothetical protein [uncultured Mucilaginibacter sp.]|uniref:hypothetical protein n=1 Tax=uncultured Mucilaginibacter sp. TaxID=797541 RepID=UPI0025EB88DD|nr:hypothetical protein [uncultured Mucilaginibacter sp.]